MNGCVNRYNCRIWGSEQPNKIHEYFHDSAKINVWCGLLFDLVAGPFFFAKSTIIGGIYQGMLENYFSPQIEDWREEFGMWSFFIFYFIFSFCQSVRKAFNEREFPQRLNWEKRTNLLASQILPR
jgi:hypothetical protein